MELNKRCLGILQILSQKEDFTGFGELAKACNVTQRSIHYDIDKIEGFLLKNGYGYLEKERKKGIKLPADRNLERFILQLSNLHTPYQYAYSSKERFYYIAVTLLASIKTVKIDYFLKKLEISKNTVLKELNSAQGFLRQRGLFLIRKANVGLYVEGDECSKRAVLVELLREAVDAQDTLRFLCNEAIESKISSLLLSDLFANIDANKLQSLLRLIQDNLSCELCDEDYVAVLYNLAILHKRAKLSVLFPAGEAEDILASAEFTAAKAMLEAVENYFQLPLHESNTAYFAFLLLRSRRIRGNSEEGCDPRGLYAAVESMVECMELNYSVQFAQSKPKLIDDLLLFIKPMIFRAKHNSPSKNPLFEDVLAQYGDLFEKTRSAAVSIERLIERVIDDHEVSYLALHFGAALHRHNLDTPKARVALVCGLDAAAANFVSSAIEKMFNVEIVKCVSSRKILQTPLKDIDYIISTSSIAGLSQTDYVQISPLMTELDYNKLSRLLGVKIAARKNFNNEIATSAKLVDIVSKYSEVRDRRQLQHEFLYELIHSSPLTVGKKTVYRLNDLLKRDLIELKVPAADWKEAIAMGAAILENAGVAGENYKQRIIDTLVEYGPYMVLLPGVVLAHAVPEEGINKLAMSLITLKTPVRFGNREFDPVRLVVTLSTIDKESHLKPLIQLFKILSGAQECKALFNARTKEEIIDIVNKFSY